MDWMKVITHPLGIAGFALALVFGVVGRVIVQKHRKNIQWIVPAAYALAAVCIVGGLALAYRRESMTPPVKPDTVGTMRIDKIDQKVGNGTAVAGVQGNVTVNAPNPQKESKPKP
jgi:hypothetical protein